ncbi:MAG: hypothetical protein ACYDBH_09130 [Acidobacteriaceae bacterium]
MARRKSTGRRLGELYATLPIKLINDFCAHHGQRGWSEADKEVFRRALLNVHAARKRGDVKEAWAWLHCAERLKAERGGL